MWSVKAEIVAEISEMVDRGMGMGASSSVQTGDRWSMTDCSTAPTVSTCSIE